MNVEELLKITFRPTSGALSVGYYGLKTVCLFEGIGKRKRLLISLRASPESVAALERLLAHFQSQKKDVAS